MIRFGLLIGTCFLYLVHELFPVPVLHSVFLLACTFVFLAFYTDLKKRGKIVTGLLFSTGLLLHYYQGDRGVELLAGINQNMAILSIIILAPLISIPLKQEGLLGVVTDRLKEQKNNARSTFYSVGTFTMILAPILNMGALRIVDGIVSKLRLPPKVLSSSYYNAVAPAFIWSPFYASVGTVLFMTDMPYTSFMLIGIGFAAVQILAGSIILRPKKNGQAKNEEGKQVSDEDRKKLIKLISFIILLLIALILEEAFTDQRMLFLVSVNCIAVPLLWALLRNKWKELKKELIHFKERSTKSSTEIGLFLSAGLFGNALVQTPFTEVVENVIIWSSRSSILLLFIILIMFMLLMAMMGIHQIVVVPVIITILLSPNVDLSLSVIAFMCVFAWTLSASISPMNPLNVIISQCVGKDGFTVALKWNGKYFLSITGIAFVYVYLLSFIA